ncbi:Gfo/Idh/MocA family oxidoreductase [Humisphaera borealis]|uniref:Gfo/Idh/MocA family oxidoreductase n=1 Tax=Humisphaera borealis TaxID=2807512 RepID=A0A7M2X407_9BACT|nr:Gfo/Idh/MocA family oxidoreductase [Humisphaera borealis]
MNRREFMALGLAAGVAVAAQAQQKENEKSIRVGLIGHTGRGNYGHGLDVMWQQVAGTQVVAVADADAAGLEAARKKLGGVPGYADYRKMLAEVRPQVVAVGPRYVDEHLAMILAAVDAGVRGIYIEKPFCRTPAEADAIVEACEKQNVKLAIAHRNRYHPALNTVSTLVKDGAIGKLLELRGRGKEDARGGSLDLWVLGSHVLNLVHFFAGAPLSCTATVLQDRKPITKADVKDGGEGVGPLAGNEVHARFETESGIPAFFDSVANAGAKNAGFGLQLIGTAGVIDLRMDTEPFAHLLPGNPFQPVREPRTWTPISTAGVGKPEPIEALAKQVMSHAVGGRDLLAAIREDRSPLCGPRDGRVIVEMINAVFESQRLGSARVPFPLTKRQAPLSVGG